MRGLRTNRKGAQEAICVAGDHRGSGFTDRDRDRVRRQTLHRSLGAAPGCQPGPAGRRRRAAADCPRRRSLLIPPQRKCSAKPPARLELPCLFSYLVNRTVEDGDGILPKNCVAISQSWHTAFSLARHVSAYGVLRHAMCPRIGCRASVPRRCGCQNGTDQALWAPRPTLVEDLDHPGDWRVEYFDSDGAYYITIFMGRMAEARARDYFEAMTHGGINNRIADAQARGPFKLEWTHTVSPRRSADAGSCVRRIQRSTLLVRTRDRSECQT
jgi:hypothetical protein